MKIGVIGVGVIGQRHLRHLAAHGDVEIAAVCGASEERAADVAREYGAEPYTDYKQLFERTPLDAAFVCTPPGLRKGPVAEAAARGVACFIEKPPARTLEEACAIADIVGNSGIVHSVGFMYRYTGAVSKAKALLEADGRAVPIARSIHVCGAGLIGAKTPNWLFDKSLSGGPLFDQAIHLMDATRYLVGRSAGEATGIHAFGGNVRRPKSDGFTVEENFVVNVSYASGTIHTHTHSWGIAESQAKIELLSDDYRLLVDLTRLGSCLSGHYKGEEIYYRYEDENMYAEEVGVFLDAVRTGESSHIRSSYEDAVRSLELVVRANESADGRRSLALGGTGR